MNDRNAVGSVGQYLTRVGLYAALSHAILGTYTCTFKPFHFILSGLKLNVPMNHNTVIGKQLLMGMPIVHCVIKTRLVVPEGDRWCP